MKNLRVVILKPSKYGLSGSVERFRWGFIPNATVQYMLSMTPEQIGDCLLEKYAIDEYVQTDLEYLKLLQGDKLTLLALVGTQSHQFQRALDIAAYAYKNGVHCVIGGPHPMTCDTKVLQNRGISFALAEAEMVWPTILRDAIRGELQPIYGQEQRWQQTLEPPVLIPPSPRDLKRSVTRLLGVYPARGCPFTCNFCSVIKIAGRKIRSQPIETTLETLRRAIAAGVKSIFFTSDNFNKYPEATELLKAMVEENLRIPFMVQCDTQLQKQEELIDLLARAGCFQIFLGVESFDRETLLSVHKTQNHPELYERIIAVCRKHKLRTHFSNIIGFPTQTERGILEHLETLRKLQPGAASFYVLTPIPGTEQYDDFRAKNLITEPNLDRFDCTVSTWRHPHLSPDTLKRLLYRCYSTFYSGRHILHHLFEKQNQTSRVMDALSRLSPLFYQYSAWQKIHPMSGGIYRVHVDNASDYRELRKKRFGCDLVPLPESLKLSAADHALNASAKLELVHA